MTASKPNILFIFSDQHRFDVMGCAGYPNVVTPNLDALAARGVRFDRAWCQSPICQPSRASLVTGRHPYDLNLFYNDKASATHAAKDGGEAAVEIDPNWPTFMKQLQKAGYETASIGKTHYHGIPSPAEIEAAGGAYDMRDYGDLVASFGWDFVMEEFDKYLHASRAFRTPYSDYLEDKGLGKTYRQQIRSVFRLTPTHWRGETSVLPQEHDLTTYLSNHACEWLQQRTRTDPFFLKVGFVQPHVPLIDDPTWAAFYADADVPVPDLTPPEKATTEWAWYIDELRGHSQAATMDEAGVREGIRHYLGMVSLLDQEIGRLLSTLEAQDALENTWIVYSCDHGEMLGDHGLWAKMNFYKESVQVPLIIVPPGGGTGRVSDALCELTDISATLCDVAGIDVPEGCRGQSLRPHVEGPDPDGSGHEYLYSRIQSYAALRDERYRFTMEMNSGEACELFDLYEDPNERINLVNDPGFAGRVAHFKDTAIAFQQQI